MIGLLVGSVVFLYVFAVSARRLRLYELGFLLVTASLTALLANSIVSFLGAR